MSAALRGEYAMQIVTKAYFDALRDRLFEGRGGSLAMHIAEVGHSYLMWLNDGWFAWCCPTCGYLAHGQLGEQPVSGWDAPRWLNSGTLDAPTLAPSLGCPNWRAGTCTGHWWMREGKLVAA